MADNDEFDSPAPVAVNVEPLSPTDEADVLGPTGLAALGVSNVWLPDRGANIDCGTNEVELRPVVPAVSDGPVCVPGKDPPTLLDALPSVPVDPVRGGDKLDAVDAVFEDPLRPARGTGALRLGVAVAPRLVGGTACVSAELVDKPIPLTVRFGNVFPIGTHGADNPSRLLVVCIVWLGWPVLPVWPVGFAGSADEDAVGLWICAASAAEAHAKMTQLIKGVFITIFPSFVRVRFLENISAPTFLFASIRPTGLRCLSRVVRASRSAV